MRIIIALFLLAIAARAEFDCSKKYECLTNAAPLTGSSGLFTDGSGEQEDYKNDLKHCIKIAPSQIPQNSRVKLTFSRKDVEDNFDFIVLYDLDGDKCLDNDVDVSTSYYSKKGFVVYFVTDNSVTKKGFSGKFAVESSEPTVPNADEVSINVYFAENHKQSHTEKFQNAGRLMIRRGESVQFSLSNRLKFKNLRLMLQGSDMKKPYVMLPDGLDMNDGFKLEKKDTRYVLTVPVNAPVGVYSVDCVLEDGTIISDNLVMYVLFNPWHQKDQVFMNGKTDLIGEYVENSAGLLYTGEYGKAFRYSFYDPQVIKGIMKVLDGLSAKDRMDVVKVSRYISWRANNDVLHGRWDGKYSDGKEPSFWNDIGVIITQWSTTGVRVKYGQCWVFSGVVLAISRGLGIPCRSVTNINSAHERQPFDQKCTQKWIQKGTSWEQYSDEETDSIWNFHVWNEGVFIRSDLSPPRPAEWNAYDGTCQEMSEGKCQCGPANIPLIREKQYQKFDSAFVAGETDCLLSTFTKPDKATKFTLLRTDECEVGSKTLTKKVGSNNVEDVSLSYKKDEKCRSTSFIQEYERERHTVHEQGELKFEIDLPPKSMKIDQSLDVGIIVTGVAAKDIVSVSVKADMTDQRGQVLPDANKQSQQSEQKPQEEVKGKTNKRENAMPPVWTFSKVADISGSRAVAKASVDPKSYLNFLSKSRFIRLSVSVTVSNSKNEQYGFYVQSKQVTLKLPDLKIISVPQNLHTGQTGAARVSWKNILPFPVKNAKLSYAYSGSGSQKLEVVQFEIPAGADAVFNVPVKGVKPGKNRLTMALVGDEVNNIGGGAEYEVTETPRRFQVQARMGEVTSRRKVGVTSEDVGRQKNTQEVDKATMGKISQSKGTGGQVNHLRPHSKGTAAKVNNMKVKKPSQQVNAKVRVAQKDQKKELQPKKSPPPPKPQQATKKNEKNRRK